MSKHKSSGFLDEMLELVHELCLNAPVWVGPAVAVGVLVFVSGLLPLVATAVGEPSFLTEMLAMLTRYVGYGLAVAALLGWVRAEWDKFWLRRRFDQTADLGALRQLSWSEFELRVGEAYRRLGYAVQRTGSASGDGGVDLRLRRDGQTVLVQCKCWKKWRVGVKTVRELHGVVAAENAARGIVVTVGDYTKQARTFAQGLPLDLIDGPGLWRLIEAARQDKPAAPPIPQAAAAAETPTRPQAPAAFAAQATAQAAGSAQAPAPQSPPPSAPAVAEAPQPPICPNCNIAMVQRTARKGPHQGKSFWGCSNWPKCKAIASDVGRAAANNS